VSSVEETQGELKKKKGDRDKRKHLRLADKKKAIEKKRKKKVVEEKWQRQLSFRRRGKGGEKKNRRKTCVFFDNFTGSGGSGGVVGKGKRL